MRLNSFETISELLMYRATEQSEKTAITFIDSKLEEVVVSYKELDNRAKAIAAELQQNLKPKERILLLYHPSVEYIAAFFGCLYAGVIPVPAYPPDSKNLLRLLLIMKDCDAAYALSTTKVIEYVKKLSNNTISNTTRKQSIDFLSKVNWIATDTIKNEKSKDYTRVKTTPKDIVFLQYTSGSTGTPKGVILDNINLLDNLKVTQQSFGIYHPKAQVVSWLPPYHDMGLIGGILQPIYSGITLVAMAPMTFLKRPFIWLDIISRKGALGPIISGAPNFAYDLCVERITETQLKQLDLTNWYLAFSGAEPVRPNTLRVFLEKFETTGFNYKAFLPVYGLAEGTLLTSSGKLEQVPMIINTDYEKVKRDIVEIVNEKATTHTLEFVACGTHEEGHEIAIVNPETLLKCNELEIGEIWLKSPSVAKGYWNNAELTQKSFYCFIENTKEGPYFRTGDMGFLHQQQLYISGRIKDMIVIRGKNYFPQDIELAVEQIHEGLRNGCGVAIAVEKNNQEALVVIQEVKREFIRKINFPEVLQNIRRAIFAEFGLQVEDILLIKSSALPKTSSGKLQRRKSKEIYLEDDFIRLEPNTTTNFITTN